MQTDFGDAFVYAFRFISLGETLTEAIIDVLALNERAFLWLSCHENTDLPCLV